MPDEHGGRDTTTAAVSLQCREGDFIPRCLLEAGVVGLGRSMTPEQQQREDEMINDDDGGESNTPTFITKNANVNVTTSFASPSSSFLSSSAPCAGTAAGGVVACAGPVPPPRSLSHSFPTTQNAIAVQSAVSIQRASSRSSRCSSRSASDSDSDPTMAEWTADGGSGGEGGIDDHGGDGTQKGIKKARVDSANNSRNLRPRSATMSSRTSSSFSFSKNATSKNTKESADGCTIDAVRRSMQPLLLPATASTNSATTTATMAAEVVQKDDACRQSGVVSRGRESEDAQRRRWATRAGFVWLAVTTSCSAWAALVDNLPGLPAT